MAQTIILNVEKRDKTKEPDITLTSKISSHAVHKIYLKN